MDHLRDPRIKCRQCRAVRQVEVPFADGQRSYTRAFERYAQTLLRRMTIKDVALHLGVHWSVIKEIDKRHLGRRFHRIRLADLKRLAIDEISIGKGQGYLTVVLDLESGAVVIIGEGKSADVLYPFWRKLLTRLPHERVQGRKRSPRQFPRLPHLFTFM